MARPLVARNYGGSRQVSVVDAEDLAAIDTVDPARWAATSVPVGDLQCDPAFLNAIDVHSKGRIRVSEVIGARNWAFERLADRRGLAQRSDTLALGALDQAKDAGKRLRKAAEHVLVELKAADKERVSLKQVRDFMAGYTKTLANGDGIVCPELLPEPDAAAYVRDVLAVVPAVTDASGKPGIGKDELARFVSGAEEYLAWRRRGQEPAILPWAEDTAAAATLVAEVEAKVEEFFLHCELLRHHGIAPTKPTADELKALRDAPAIHLHLLVGPLAPPTPEAVLPLETATANPVWKAKLERLRPVISRAIGPETALTRDAWRRVRDTFAAHRAWREQKPALPFERLSPERLAEALRSPALERVRHFIALDTAAATEVKEVQELERLILHQRWVVELANNVVNFSAIYHPERPGLVERGSLVIDGRRLEFCVKAEDRANHRKVAAESLIFLVYANVTARDVELPPFDIVAPVTAGERGRLRIGKRGLFIDIEGREWDAIVVDIVENPISIREAIVAPFRRAAVFLNKKLEDLAASRLAEAETKTQEHVAKLPDAVPAAAPGPAPAPGAPAPAPGAPAAPAAPAAVSGLQNMLLMGTMAIAALGSAAAYIVSAISNISPLELLGGVLSIVGLIGALSGFIGWLKLRRRDISLLLEANGWAVNVPIRVTGRVGDLFTRTPPFPRGTRRELGEALPEEELDEEKLELRRRRRRRVRLSVAFALVCAACTWLAWSPEHRAQAWGWWRWVRAKALREELPAEDVEADAPAAVTTR